MRANSTLRSVLGATFLLVHSVGVAQPPELSRAEVRLTAQLERAFQRESAPRVRGVLARAFRQPAARQETDVVLLQATERLLVEFGRAEDAEFALEQLPDPSGALEGRVAARAELIRGNLDATHALMARWAQRQDRLAAALLRDLATAWVRQGSLAEAQRSLELARRVLPQDRALLIELVSVHLARGLPSPAIALLQSRLQLASHDEDARRRLALAYHAAGRADDAIGELLRLGEAVDVCAAARVALEHGDVPRSVALARRAVGAASTPLEEGAGQRALGFALARSGQRAAAIRALRRSLVLDPNVVEAQTRLEELGGSGS